MSVQKAGAVRPKPIQPFFVDDSKKSGGKADSVGPAGNGSGYLLAQYQPKAPQTGQKDHPLFPAKKANKKAQGYFEKGQSYLEKKQWGKAGEYFEKAVNADSENPKYAWALIQVLFQVGAVMPAYQGCSQLLNFDPKFLPARILRAQAGTILLQNASNEISDLQKAPKEKQATAQRNLVILQHNYLEDRLIVLVTTSEKVVEEIQKAKSEVAKAHGKPLKERQGILEYWEGQASEAIGLTKIPQSSFSDKATSTEKLTKICSAIYSLLAEFANADSDPAIKAKAKYYEGMALLTQGQFHEVLVKKADFDIQIKRSELKKAESEKNEGVIATKKNEIQELNKITETGTANFTDLYDKGMVPLRQYYEESLSRLGGGDLKQGKIRLEEAAAKAEKAIKEKNEKDLIQAMQGIPLELRQTHMLISQYDANRLAEANQIIFQIWRSQNWSKWNAEIENKATVLKGLNSFFNPFADGREKVYGDINTRSAKQDDLMREVELRVDTGKAKSITEALGQIEANGSGDLKLLAKELNAGGGDDLNRQFLAKLIHYVCNGATSGEQEKQILAQLDLLGKLYFHDVQSARIYALIYKMSRDPEVRKIAETGYKKVYPDQKI